MEHWALLHQKIEKEIILNPNGNQKIEMGADYYIETAIKVEYVFNAETKETRIEIYKRPGFYPDHDDDIVWNRETFLESYSQDQVIFDGTNWITKDMQTRYCDTVNKCVETECQSYIDADDLKKKIQRLEKDFNVEYLQKMLDEYSEHILGSTTDPVTISLFQNKMMPELIGYVSYIIRETAESMEKKKREIIDYKIQLVRKVTYAYPRG